MIDVEPTASARFERALGRFQTAARLAGTTLAVADLAILSPTYRRPRVAWTAVAALVGHGAWVASRQLGEGGRDRTSSMTEVPAAIALIVIDRFAAGPSSPLSGPRPSSDYVGNAALLHSSGFTVPSEALPGLVALAAATVFGMRRERVGNIGGVLVDALLVMQGLIANAIVQGLRQQAEVIDDANEHGRAGAAESAREQEWRRQHRLVHDSVLQTLELIGGGWNVDREVIARRIDLDLDRLSRLLLRSDTEVPVDVAGSLSDLVAEFAVRGLEIEVTTDLDDLTTRAESVDALVSAPREALTNVQKHAGGDRAHLSVLATPTTLRIDVRDDGVGFAPGTTRREFGLAHSIVGRLADVGGWSMITSSPGTGVEISMGVPR